uniref:Uncharacterized protein n=1 Tax=viral metagenome TaxID=1070528 RepID=A0A6C0LZR5_9ZZZZ
MSISIEQTIVYTERLIKIFQDEKNEIISYPDPNRGNKIKFKVQHLLDYLKNGMLNRYAECNWKKSTITPDKLVTFLLWFAKSKGTISEYAALLKYTIAMLNIPRDEFGFPKWFELDINSKLYKSVCPERWEEHTMEKIIHKVWSDYKLRVICQKKLDNFYFDACCEDVKLIFECQEDARAHEENQNDIEKKHVAYKYGYDIIYFKQYDEKKCSFGYYNEFFNMLKDKIEGSLLTNSDDYVNQKVISMFINKFKQELVFLEKCIKFENNFDTSKDINLQKYYIKLQTMTKRKKETIEGIIDNIEGKDRSTILTIFKIIDETAKILEKDEAGDDYIIPIETICKMLEIRNTNNINNFKQVIMDHKIHRCKNNNIYINSYGLMYVFTKLDLSLINPKLSIILQEYLNYADVFYKVIINKIRKHHHHRESIIMEGFKQSNEYKLNLECTRMMSQIDELISKNNIVNEENKQLKTNTIKLIQGFQIVSDTGNKLHDLYKESITSGIIELKDNMNKIKDNDNIKKVLEMKKSKYKDIVIPICETINEVQKKLDKLTRDTNHLTRSIKKDITICNQYNETLIHHLNKPKIVILQKYCKKEIVINYSEFKLYYTGDENDKVTMAELRGRAKSCGIPSQQIDIIVRYLMPPTAQITRPDYLYCVLFEENLKNNEDNDYFGYKLFNELIMNENKVTKKDIDKNNHSEKSDEDDSDDEDEDESEKLDDFEDL